MPSGDIEGYIELRQRLKLPIVLHHAPLGHSYEVLMKMADIHMLGHAKIGYTMQRAGLFAASNIPFMLQNVGGDITRAMTTHMMAAFPTGSFHFFSDAETWKSDVVEGILKPVNGFLRVPEEPGLGVSLNRDEPERLQTLRLPVQEKWIIKSQFANGTRMYNIANPVHSIFMLRPDLSRHVPMSYATPISTEYWDNDGSDTYRAMFDRIEAEGVVLE